MRRTVKAISVFCGLLTASLSYANDIRGNGGDLVVCRNSGGAIISSELLDYYEGRVVRAIHPKFPTNISDPVALAEAVAARLAKLDPNRNEYLRSHIRSFPENRQFVSGVNLVDIPDSDHLVIPNGCAVEQFAIRHVPEFPGDKLFLVNDDLWNAASVETKAGLILHEAIYGETLAANQTNSIRARYFNSIISSERILTMEIVDYRTLLNNVGLGFTPVEPGPASCHGFNIPGDYRSLNEALTANRFTGGVFCVRKGADMALNVVLDGGAFEIVGEGTDATPAHLGIVKLGCENCRLTMRDFNLSTDFNLNSIGEKAKIELVRMNIPTKLIVELKQNAKFSTLRLNTALMTLSVSSGAVVNIDRSHMNSLLVNGIAYGGDGRAQVRVSNSLFDKAREVAGLSVRGYWPGLSVTLVNNTIWNNTFGVSCQTSSTSPISLILQSNLIASNWTGFIAENGCQFELKTNAILENNNNYAGSAAPGANDFRGVMDLNKDLTPPRPLPSSALIGFGEKANAPTNDYFGKARMGGIDVGAVQVDSAE